MNNHYLWSLSEHEDITTPFCLRTAEKKGFHFIVFFLSQSITLKVKTYAVVI